MITRLGIRTIITGITALVIETLFKRANHI